VQAQMEARKKTVFQMQVQKHFFVILDALTKLMHLCAMEIAMVFIKEIQISVLH
jgi:hypothetical protein